VLILGVLVVAFPLYLTFVASTHTAQQIVQSPMPLLPGSHLRELHRRAGTAPAGRRLQGAGRRA
jgi:sn-glycerol 3-phosphate transport system permease protein